MWQQSQFSISFSLCRHAKEKMGAATARSPDPDLAPLHQPSPAAATPAPPATLSAPRVLPRPRPRPPACRIRAENGGQREVQINRSRCSKAASTTTPVPPPAAPPSLLAPSPLSRRSLGRPPKLGSPSSIQIRRIWIPSPCRLRLTRALLLQM